MLTFTFEGECVEVDVEKLGLAEGFALQKATSWRMPKFLEAIQEMDFEAMCALAFVILKFRMGRDDVTFDDVTSGRVHTSIDMFKNSEAPASGSAEPPDPPAGAEAKTPS